MQNQRDSAIFDAGNRAFERPIPLTISAVGGRTVADADHAVEWRAVPDFLDYEVSNTGIVRRVSYSERGKCGFRKPLPFVLSGGWGGKGYRYVAFYRGNKSYQRLLSRVVLEVFVGPPPSSSHQAAHINGDTSDNRLANLYWATVKQNHADKIRHGTHAVGENSKRAKLTQSEVEEIRKLYEMGETQRKLGERFGVSRATIGLIVRRINWAHVA